MLRKEAVVPEMLEIIKQLQSNTLFDNHILVGGTALALQLGHRTSTDIDLFTKKKQKHDEIIKYIRNGYKDNKILIANDDFIRIIINDIKVEMVCYEERTLENYKEEEGIKLYGIDDIAVMKLETILKRTEPRDFIDMAYLLKEKTLNDIFENYKYVFGSISPLYIKRALLVKSKNFKDNEWLVGGIKMLRNDIAPKDVPLVIENAIKVYNSNNDIGNENVVDETRDFR